MPLVTRDIGDRVTSLQFVVTVTEVVSYIPVVAMGHAIDSCVDVES